MPYRLPEGASLHASWEGSEILSFVPDSREKLVLDAVQAGIDAGIEYQREMADLVAKQLAVSEEILARGKNRVEGGDFGMDVYYAWRSIRGRAEAQRSLDVVATLKLTSGQKVGILVLNDGKQLSAATLESLDRETGRIVFHGSRGGRLWRVTLQGSGLVAAINRAAEKGRRKDDYEALVASRAGQSARL